jgi:hypothetical protein
MMRVPPSSLENVPWREQETELVERHGTQQNREELSTSKNVIKSIYLKRIHKQRVPMNA